MSNFNSTEFNPAKLNDVLFKGTNGNSPEIDYALWAEKIYMPAFEFLDSIRESLTREDYICSGGLIKKHVIPLEELQAALSLDGRFLGKPLNERIMFIRDNYSLTVSCGIHPGDEPRIEEQEEFSRIGNRKTRRTDRDIPIERLRYNRRKQRFNPAEYMFSHSNGKQKRASQIDPIDEIGRRTTK